MLLPQKADRQKQEVERKKWEREQTEERLRSELEEERRKRAMELRSNFSLYGYNCITFFPVGSGSFRETEFFGILTGWFCPLNRHT